MHLLWQSDHMRIKSFQYTGWAMAYIYWQDSFSKAHTRRSFDGKSIIDVCTYGSEVEGVCMHQAGIHFHDLLPSGALFEEDRIWLTEPASCNLNPRNRGWECLKPEAQLAAEVSAGYLVLYAKLIGYRLEPPAYCHRWS